MVRLHKVPTPPEHQGSRKGYYLFECDCGNQVIRRSDCPGKTCCKPDCVYSSYTHHGGSGTRLYTIWTGIKARCIFNHPSTIYYKNRGIKLDPNWLRFDIFEEWALAHGYNDTLTIDRIDIDGNYSPENCEWVLREENTRRQHADRHPNEISIHINGKPFRSLISAAKYIRDSLGVKLAYGTIRMYLTTQPYYFTDLGIQVER